MTGSVAVLAGETAYAGPLVLLLTAIPMLVVANVYRRLNQWNANCGASFLANVSPRFRTPMAPTLVAGLFLLVVSAISIYASSVGSAIGNVIDVTGWLYGSFYLLTVLAALAYFRRRIFTSFSARFVQHSPFFGLQQESASNPEPRDQGGGPRHRG